MRWRSARRPAEAPREAEARTPASSQSLSAKDLEGQLKFYNWAQYVNPANTKAYTDTTGVKFEEANFTSNEQLLTKLQTTKGQKTYDIIVPDADHVRIEKDLGLLMKLDHSLIPNLKNLAPHWTQVCLRPGQRLLGRQGHGDHVLHAAYRQREGRAAHVEGLLRLPPAFGRR